MRKGVSDPTAECSTLVQLLRWRALHQPDRLAFTFLVNGDSEERHLTWAGLDRKACAIAASLQQAGATGGRVLLMYSPGLEYIAAFFGCLYAGAAAVPVYPPNPSQLNRGLSRFRAITNDVRPSVALTTSSILPITSRLLVQAPDPQHLHWLATDKIEDGMEDEWTEQVVTKDSLALLQYTSGSTATPKGVMLTHGNLLHNSALIYRSFKHTPDSRGVIWLPPYHDMGLVGGVLQPLYGGCQCTLMSPVSFLQRPFNWLHAISRCKATTSGGPDFAYDLCVRRITPEQRATLDLSSWEVAFDGAEPIRAATLERFVTVFEGCGFRREAFYPCYGLAEATLIVSGGEKEAPPIFRAFQSEALAQKQIIEVPAEHAGAQTLVGCGHSLPDQRMIIADPETLTQCPPDQIGEIWVHGPSVAKGYWNRSEETEQAFRASLAPTGEGPFLRTGDLGFFHDHELFVIGRLKDLIIIAGRNLYPQDIEQTVEQSHPALRSGCGAAFSIDINGEERLVVVQELERQNRDVDLDAIVRAVRRAVAEYHDAQVYSVALLKTGKIPKTSSGKIQRHACRAAFLSGTLEVVKGNDVRV
jgi:acyl-CoA synthetase (AMP-forming)/AMP-acid ligase II